MDKKYHALYQAKAEALVAQMTLEEKASQLRYDAPAIPRLGIPSYNWWNEGLHGVARAGSATMFPQAIGLAATFDPDALHQAGRITALEGRIKYNHAQKQGDHGIYRGLTFWSPNINIFRDPRWGRGHETYGEDPVLTSLCGEQFIRGIQEGDDDRYLMAAACVKHFAVHSGPEGIRHGFDSEVSDFDLQDTYLPAFAWCIRRADAQGLMGAYNMINGIPSCVHPLLQETVREKWGFSGYVVSDCWALADIHRHCKYTPGPVESAAAALKAGCDINCGVTYQYTLEACREGLVSEEEIHQAAVRAMATRMKLGLFDPDCPYHKEQDYLKVECADHRKAAYETAVKSLVLLKNNGLLPLEKNKLTTIGVIGPNAASIPALEGNYNSTSSRYTTVLQGIQQQAGDEIRVLYARGCHLYKDRLESCALPEDSLSEALTVAENSDLVVMVLGLDPTIEGEEGDASNEYGAGDKEHLNFPGLQQKLLEQVSRLGKPMVLVVLSGSALDLSWAQEHTDAILQGWYPGSEGGRAIADLLFGDADPSGRLPVTFYRSHKDLPDFADYSMKGRTYRYLEKEPLYPFGYGLSYTTFAYGPARITGDFADGRVQLSLEVTNTGSRAGDHAVQAYATYGKERWITPRCKFCGVARTGLLQPGETRTVTITVEREAVLLTDRDGSRYFPESLKLGVYADSQEAANG